MASETESREFPSFSLVCRAGDVTSSKRKLRASRTFTFRAMQVFIVTTTCEFVKVFGSFVNDVERLHKPSLVGSVQLWAFNHHFHSANPVLSFNNFWFPPATRQRQWTQFENHSWSWICINNYSSKVVDALCYVNKYFVEISRRTKLSMWFNIYFVSLQKCCRNFRKHLTFDPSDERSLGFVQVQRDVGCRKVNKTAGFTASTDAGMHLNAKILFKMYFLLKSK